MLGSQFHPFCPVASPSSSPPAPSASTPPNRKAESKLLPSPPLSCSSQEFTNQDLVWCALDYINNRSSETPGLVLQEFSWTDFDDFKDELNDPRVISAKSAESLR